MQIVNKSECIQIHDILCRPVYPNKKLPYNITLSLNP